MFLIWTSSANIISIPFVKPVNISSREVSNAIVAMLNRLVYPHFGFAAVWLHALIWLIITPLGFPVDPEV